MSENRTLYIILIIILLTVFPLLWLYNQTINYRGVFQTDQHFLLRSPNEYRGELSSVPEIIGILNKSGVKARLSPKILTGTEFGVVGRIVTVPGQDMDVYEYESPVHAEKTLKGMGSENVYRFKNLLINNLPDGHRKYFEGGTL